MCHKYMRREEASVVPGWTLEGTAREQPAATEDTLRSPSHAEKAAVMRSLKKQLSHTLQGFTGPFVTAEEHRVAAEETPVVKVLALQTQGLEHWSVNPHRCLVCVRKWRVSQLLRLCW